MIEVSILGSTGLVGQRFIQLLSQNPGFKVTHLVASNKRRGSLFKDSVHWLLEENPSEAILNQTLHDLTEEIPTKIVFSALPSDIAGPVEEELAKKEHIVFSNASAHRYDPFVPIIVPEVNPEHFNAVKFQGTKGFIITNPNCSTAGLVIPLKAIKDKFGLKEVLVVTMQALSGAGFPGVPALSIYDNLIPYIEKEEEKIKKETRKILGKFENVFEPDNLKLDARCNRVGVREGHTEIVFVALEDNPSEENFIETLKEFKGLPQELNLISSPCNPIIIRSEIDRPQPLLDRSNEKGMAVTVGRVEKSSLFSFTFTILSHNTIRGAAGGSIENAELFLKEGLLDV
jgi:aspartate-semialdehyde dehydrogenase